QRVGDVRDYEDFSRRRDLLWVFPRRAARRRRTAIGSLGMNMDSERSGARLAVRLITGKNQSCGTFVTPFIPGKFRPTPIRNDGTRYRWTLRLHFVRTAPRSCLDGAYSMRCLFRPSLSATSRCVTWG